MIASLTGTVTAIGLDYLVLSVAGIGYHVRTSPPMLANVRHGEEVTLATELVVREDSLTLYGFSSNEEVELFRTVQSVSGIGPRIAIAVLAVMPPSQFAQAIMAEDIKAITSIPGIGPKGAKRLALELKEKVAPFVAEHGESGAEPSAHEPEGAIGDGTSRNPHSLDVAKALVGLGWSEKPAGEAIDAVLDQTDEASPGSAATVDAAQLLRLSLRQLGGRQ